MFECDTICTIYETKMNHDDAQPFSAVDQKINKCQWFVIAGCSLHVMENYKSLKSQLYFFVI